VKTIIYSCKRTFGFKVLMALFTCLSFLMLFSCQKDESEQDYLMSLFASSNKEKPIAPSGKITDVDGNTYKTVKIGEQWWMAENLKTTKYNDGTVLPCLTVSEWVYPAFPAYGWYEDNEKLYKDKYAAYYNYYTIDYSNGKNICPDGWHVPTAAEWNILSDYLKNNGYGYGGIAENIAKSMAQKKGWEFSATEGTPGNDPQRNNSSSFSGVPTGYHNPYPMGTVGWYYKGQYCCWWQSDGISYHWQLDFYRPVLWSNWDDASYGFNIRCLKD
jgi:uncharacterized protein (TIGR02145 family)